MIANYFIMQNDMGLNVTDYWKVYQNFELKLIHVLCLISFVINFQTGCM